MRDELGEQAAVHDTDSTQIRRLHRTTINPNASTRTPDAWEAAFSEKTPGDRQAKPASQKNTKTYPDRALANSEAELPGPALTLSLCPSRGAVLLQPVTSLPTPPLAESRFGPFSRTGSRVMLIRSTSRT